MAQTEIGKLSVRISANAKELEAAVDQSARRLQEFASGGIETAFRALANPFGAAGGGLGKILGIAEGAGGPLGAAVGVVGSLTAGFAELGRAAAEAGEHHLHLARQAELYGISAQALIGLQIAAKDKSEEMGTGLMHLQRDLGAAAGGSKEAQDKFNSLGVSWESLVDLPIDVAFGKVNDAIANSATQAEAGRKAFEIYGRQGQQLLNLIRQGSAGIEAGQLKAAMKNLEPSPEFLAAYKEFKGATADLDRSMEGVKNKFMDAFGTPTLSILASWKRDLASIADELFGLGANAPEEMARKRAADEQLAAQQKAARLVGESKKAQSDALEMATADVKTWEQKIAVLTRGADAVREFEIRTKAGVEASQRLNDELAKRNELTQRFADLQAAEKLTGQTVGGFEKAASDLEQLRGLFGRGVISQGLLDRGIGMISANLLRNVSLTDTGFAAASVRGTAADRTLNLKFDRAAELSQQDPVEKLREVIAQQLQVEREQKVIQQQIADAVKEGRLNIVKF